MYAIYAYIGVVLGVNVGIYVIYGVSGLHSDSRTEVDIMLFVEEQRSPKGHFIPLLCV